MPKIWIERDFSRTDVTDIEEAKRRLRKLWPNAFFSEPIELGKQTVTHVRRRPRRLHELTGPDAVIVEET